MTVFLFLYILKLSTFKSLKPCFLLLPLNRPCFIRVLLFMFLYSSPIMSVPHLCTNMLRQIPSLYENTLGKKKRKIWKKHCSCWTLEQCLNECVSVLFVSFSPAAHAWEHTRTPAKGGWHIFTGPQCISVNSFNFLQSVHEQIKQERATCKHTEASLMWQMSTFLTSETPPTCSSSRPLGATPFGFLHSSQRGSFTTINYSTAAWFCSSQCPPWN